MTAHFFPKYFDMEKTNRIKILNILLITSLLVFSGKLFALTCEYDENRNFLVLRDSELKESYPLSGENYIKCFAKAKKELCTPENAEKYKKCLKEITESDPFSCVYVDAENSLDIIEKKSGKKYRLSGDTHTKCRAKLNSPCNSQTAPKYLSCLNEITKSAKGSGDSSAKPYSPKTAPIPKHSGRN